MAKRATIIGVGLALLVFLASPAAAVTMGIIDSQNGWTVEYTLTYNLVGDHYAASLTIDTSLVPGPVVNGDWYITDVAFKFYDGQPVITITTPVSSGLLPFARNGGSGGFYGFAIPGGLLIADGGGATYDFTFKSDSLVAKDDFVNFFVDYTGAQKTSASLLSSNGNFQTNLSSELKVPEPGTVALLGTGLLGMFMFRRFRK